MSSCGPTGVTSDPTWPRLNTSPPRPLAHARRPHRRAGADPRAPDRVSAPARSPTTRRPSRRHRPGHSRDKTVLGTVPRNHPDLVTGSSTIAGPSPARPLTSPAPHQPAPHQPGPSPADPATATPTQSRGGSGLTSGRGADVRRCCSHHFRAPERRLSRERPLRLSGSPRRGRPGRGRCPRRLG